MLVGLFPADEGFICFNFASEIADTLFEQRADLIEHAPRGLVGNAKFPLKLLRGDSASGACHQVDRVEPQMQRRGRFVVDRSRRRVQVITARGARPRLPLLLGRVTMKHPLGVALRTMGVRAIRRKAVAPQLLKASLVVAELAHELHQRVARFRRRTARRRFAIFELHETKSNTGHLYSQGILAIGEDRVPRGSVMVSIRSLPS
jgi:hypothetical protein